MSTIDLGKLRFNYAGPWSNTTVNEYNDVVQYGGNIYCYINPVATSGNSPTLAATGAPTAYWSLMVKGFNFIGAWSATVAYEVGQAVAFGSFVYVCVTDNSGEQPPNTTYWSQFIDSIEYQGVWSQTTAYKNGDIVTYGGTAYVSNQNQTGNTPSSSPTYWTPFVQGLNPAGIWNAATQYRKNDVIVYGGSAYLANIDNLNFVPSSCPTQWTPFVMGLNPNGVWNVATAYRKNDITTYGNCVYLALLDSTGQLPGTTASTYWQLLVPGYSPRGTWVVTTQYSINDVVTYGGTTYYATQSNLGQNPGVPSSTYWTVLTVGMNGRGIYSAVTAYMPGDVVSYGANTFLCLANSTGNAPVNVAYWTMLMSGVAARGVWVTATLYHLNDLVMSGGNTYIALVEHVSTAFATELAANQWQKFNGGFNFRRTFVAGTVYNQNDMMTDGYSLYIALPVSYVGGATAAADVVAGNLQLIAQGESALPAMAGNAGCFLTTDGAVASWLSIDDIVLFATLLDC
ncbi:hypothetical protein [Telmatospirillum sp.]|uniref:hypothetical protein n=1 Tax=Telmatospirillum sp. TaxID=2079197 RepID=UPI002850D3C6|nr:hypothetical protein [Telmatospirillum sp.]MDR3436449.1 hypothetical protein [Telmatospirillum sp.]